MAIVPAAPPAHAVHDPASEPSIVVDQLVRRFGGFTAVDGVSFEVKTGEVFGFLGPNGAGKSTTIGMLCTLLRPTAGRAFVNGFDVARQPDDVRRSIGLIFQDSSLDNYLTAQENLDFHAYAYDVPVSEARARSARLLEMVELTERRNDLVKTFSGGMRRRLEIARGLLHRPRVLFLDEPTVGLDPQTRDHIWRYILDLRAREGVTLFLTTHYMDEAENCDRIAIIDHGAIVALDTPSGLKARVGGDLVTLRTDDDARAREEIRTAFGLETEEQDGALRLEVPRGDEFVPGLVRALTPRITTIEVRRPTLDDVFLKLTGRQIRDEDASSTDQLRQMGRIWGGRRR
ncbi:MAG: ATP-binding cassette domain-containing protein [Chloroflexi bacterium]|nr:ATP-binding cassette domain-containing protein [Chloroflexota bacterium]